MIKLYWQAVVRPHIWQVLALCLSMLASSMLEMATVGLAVPLLDAVTNPDRAFEGVVLATIAGLLSSFGLTTSINTVTLALFLIASTLFLIHRTLSVCNQYFAHSIALKLGSDTRAKLFERFLHARYEEVLRRGRGAVLQDVNSPPAGLQTSIGNLAQLIAGLFSCVLLIGLMLYLSWWATLMMGILAIAGVQTGRKIAGWSAACGRAIYDVQGERSKVEVDAIDGLKVVKAHTLEGHMAKRQRSLLAAEMRSTLRLVLFTNTPILGNEVMATVVVLVLAAITFLVPSMGITFPTLVALLLAVRRVTPAMATITSASVELGRWVRSVEVIQEIEQRVKPEEQGQIFMPSVEEVRFSKVSFWYRSATEPWALDGVDLRMRRGTVTAIVGMTGSGKTTIANLLTGFYKPRSGTILVNGTNLEQLSLQGWRRKVGYVSQDTFLFNASLKENIALWDESISQDEIERAARMAQLHDFTTTLPQGYDTLVGDRGLRLSGGQCQRVAIARAILRRPEVLILDEATSALDNLTERAVYEAISALRPEAVVIVIAHRLSTVKDADVIAVLRSGEVAEIGTHDSLISLRGVYAELYEGDGKKMAEGLARRDLH